MNNNFRLFRLKDKNIVFQIDSDMVLKTFDTYRDVVTSEYIYGVHQAIPDFYKLTTEELNNHADIEWLDKIKDVTLSVHSLDGDYDDIIEPKDSYCIDNLQNAFILQQEIEYKLAVKGRSYQDFRVVIIEPKKKLDMDLLFEKIEEYI